ncbi:MAG: hypothetical protein WBO10_11030 [Pyrinomonadaceae bacterium]
MPKTPKDKPVAQNEKSDEPLTEDLWEADIEKRGYYYDDAHGYEKYDPSEDDRSENEK